MHTEVAYENSQTNPASRANGAKSKGPVTDQGKLNSSRNSTRHGLLAATIEQNGVRDLKYRVAALGEPRAQPFTRFQREALGDQGSARDEGVVELGAAFLSANLGITQ